MATVSVVIPVKNEALKIKSCIEAILSQTIQVKQIIVVDSGSTDGTLEILKQYPIVKVIEIPSSEFNHGSTRNLGVSHINSDYCLMTVGDAVACNEYWIENLMKGFVNEHVAGVCGQQIVAHDKTNNPIEWFRPIHEPRIITYQFSTDEFEKLDPEEIKEACSWDDVTAMYKTSVLKQIPFQHTTYCEDSKWAYDVLKKGYALSYNKAARVYHYHLESPDFSFKRYFTISYYKYRSYGLVPKLITNLSLKQKLVFAKLLVKSKLSFSECLKWWNYNIAMHKAVKKANNIFLNCLSQGESNLDEAHVKYCNQPPIPIKRHLNE